jgi:hypothetical protein
VPGQGQRRARGSIHCAPALRAHRPVYQVRAGALNMCREGRVLACQLWGRLSAGVLGLVMLGWAPCRSTGMRAVEPPAADFQEY